MWNRGGVCAVIFYRDFVWKFVRDFVGEYFVGVVCGGGVFWWYFMGYVVRGC